MTDSEWAALRQRMVRLAVARYGPESAEDIAQEALHQFFTADRQHVRDLTGYLLKATFNHGAYDWRRIKSRERVTEKCGRALISRKDPSPDDIVDGCARLAAVTEMIGSAGVDIMLTYSEDGPEMTATRLGVSCVHMRVLVSSVRAVLRGNGNGVHRCRLGLFRRLAERAAA